MERSLFPDEITDKFIDKYTDKSYYSIIKEVYFNMSSIINAITQTVSISQFNRGLAGKIFSDVRSTGPKAVIKNNSAEVILVPPDEYEKTNELINDYMLLTLAVERMSGYDPSALISEEDMDKRLEITKEELESPDEVIFE